MNVSPPHDPLVGLWKTAPQPNTQSLVADLRRLNRMHQRLNRSIVLILWSVAILLIAEEAAGRMRTHWILPVVWSAGLIIGVRWRRRSQCKRAAALTLDTVSLLQSMIAQAKSDLFLARCLYAGVPAGAIVGFAAMKLAVFSSFPPVSPGSHIIQAAGWGILILMIGLGGLLSRSRVLQVKALTEKLNVMKEDL